MPPAAQSRAAWSADIGHHNQGDDSRSAARAARAVLACVPDFESHHKESP
jgi:hypothetical protein